MGPCQVQKELYAERNSSPFPSSPVLTWDAHRLRFPHAVPPLSPVLAAHRLRPGLAAALPPGIHSITLTYEEFRGPFRSAEVLLSLPCQRQATPVSLPQIPCALMQTSIT